MKMLDLAKFEKVKEDKHTTTMRHKDGHEMTILIAKLPKIHREQLKRLKMAEGGSVEAEHEDKADKSAFNMPPAANTIPENVPNAQLPSPAADALSAQAQPQLPVDQNLGNPTNAALTQGNAAQLAERAGNLQQQIDTAKAQGTLPLAQQQQKNAVEIQNRQNQTIADMKKHADDFASYLQANPVDPKHYAQSLGTAQKVSTALGLILGGFSGGFSGTGKNPALDFLQSQQDKDIQAQKDRMGQAKTIYGAYHDLYGDENVSTALAKVSMNDKLLADSNVLNQKLATPQSNVANLNLRANLLQKNYELLQKAAFLANQPKGGAPAQSGQNPEMGGSKGQVKYGPDTSDKTGVYNIEPILAPGAQEQMQNLQRRASAGDPVAVSNLPQAQAQYADAAQRDEMLSQAPALFKALAENATEGGWVHRHIAGTSVPGEGIVPDVLNTVGQHAGALWNNVVNMNNKVYGSDQQGNPNPRDENRKEEDYNTAKNQLSDYLSKAYPHSTGAERGEKLQGILSDLNSDPENMKKHIKSFEDLVKTGGQYNVLKNEGLAR